MKSLQEYFVDDLFFDIKQVEVTFLLESPYSSEVIHKHPLAGDSGRSVTKFFKTKVGNFNKNERMENTIPFGCLLKETAYPKIAIVNCSNYPLDKSVYSCNSIENEDLSKKIEGWDFLRHNSASMKRKKQCHKQLEDDFLADLQRRLAKFPKNTLIIPCGKVALNFFKKVKTENFLLYPDSIPHPSRNQWVGKDAEHKLNKMREAIVEKLEIKEYKNFEKCLFDMFRRI